MASKTFSVSEFVFDTLCEVSVADGPDLSLTGPMLASGAIGSSAPDPGAGFVPDSADLSLCVKSEFEFLKSAFFD